MCYVGANTTSPCPPRTGFNCCLPEKVVQAPTSFLLLLPLSKLMVFVYPREETPFQLSAAGSRDAGAAQCCRTDPDPRVSHTSAEKMLGVGCKQPLRYFYCSESVLYPAAIIPAGTWKVQTPWSLHREMICHALPWDFLLPPPVTVLHPPGVQRGAGGGSWHWGLPAQLSPEADESRCLRWPRRLS